LLGNAYRGRVTHREYEVNGQKRIHASLRSDDGYTISPPVIEVMDDESSEVVIKPIKVAPPLTDLKLFLWDNPDMEQWASIYIPGEYAAHTDDSGKVLRPARSKNVLQERIMSALNWLGSPMQILLEEGNLDDVDDVEIDEEAAEPETVAATKVETKKQTPVTVTADDDDPLADLDG